MTKTIYEMSYVEIVDHAEKVVLQLCLKAYGEGYERGKFDAQLDGFCGMTAEEMTKEVQQEKRDQIVERAKKVVEFLISDIAPKVEFVVNKDKRTIVALLKHSTCGFIVSKGIAKCAPEDCFNVHIGKAIALRRALGLEVPDEYLNAPQPMVVRVGDMIRMKYYNPGGDRPDSYYVKIINSFDGDKIWYEGGGFDFREDVYSDAKIIDDSRDGDE